MRINANLKAATVEELRGRKHAMHLAAFDYANAETARTLARLAAEGCAEERVARDWTRSMPVQDWLHDGGKEEDLVGCMVAGGTVTFTVEGMLGKLRRACAAVRARHAAVPAERFSADGVYRALAEEMLVTGAAAVSCLRWYLEDTGKGVEHIMRVPIVTGHRVYLGFLERTLPAVGEVRVTAAGRLCRARGAMERSPDEVDAEGFTPLIRAAANGAGARVLRSLVAARANLEARDGGLLKSTALWWAANMGNSEAVVELGRLGADVNTLGQPGFLDGTPFMIAAFEGHTGVIEALGRLGADVNRADKYGRTPLQIAYDMGQSEAAAVLEQLGGR